MSDATADLAAAGPLDAASARHVAAAHAARALRSEPAAVAVAPRPAARAPLGGSATVAGRGSANTRTARDASGRAPGPAEDRAAIYKSAKRESQEYSWPVWFKQCLSQNGHG